MGLNQFLRNWRFVKHIKPSQVVARFRLTVKRKLSQFGVVRRIAKYQYSIERQYHISDDLSGTIMPARLLAIVTDDGGFKIALLNKARNFRLPIDWHLDELNTGTRLWKLNLHYMEYLESIDDENFQLIVSDWIEQNPPFEDTYWLDNWNSYALSIRTVVWMQQYAIRKGRLERDFVSIFKHSLWQQLEFLSRNVEYDIVGNHLIKNIKALLWGSEFFTDRTAKSWGDLAKRLLGIQLVEQFLEDDMHYERSPAYACQVFVDLLECSTVYSNDALNNVIQKLSQCLADLSHPDGRVALFNDGGLSMTYSTEECLAVYEKMSGNKVVPRRHFSYPNTGYFGFHSENVYFICDCGNVAPDNLVAHGHADILSFELSVNGKRVIVDPGVYEYSAGVKRDYSRNSLSHNTVTIAHTSQCEFWGAFRMGRRATAKLLQIEKPDSGIVVEGTHNGYSHLSGNPAHTRKFELSSNQISILDAIANRSDHAVSAGLLIAPGLKVELTGSNEATISDGKPIVRITSDGNIHLSTANYYPDFGISHEVYRLQILFPVELDKVSTKLEFIAN